MLSIRDYRRLCVLKSERSRHNRMVKTNITPMGLRAIDAAVAKITRGIRDLERKDRE